MSEWRTIDSAPKDGTEIIGVFYYEWNYGDVTVYGPWTIAWDGKKWRSSWDESEVIEYSDWSGTDYKQLDSSPTHWMPLPNPPT